MTIRILLVDDHTLFRTGIRLVLQRQSDFDVVGEASDGAEGIKLATILRPNVVLLDLHMPGLSGLDAARQLRLDTPDSKVVMLTVSEDAEDLTEALHAGACGYLLKNIDADFLVDAVRRAARGEAVMAQAMTAKLMESFRTQKAAPAAEAEPEDHDKLTPRELEILRHLAHGQSNKEIARQLDVAESTVKIHVQNVLKKLQLSSRVQAAVYAVEHGLGTDLS